MYCGILLRAYHFQGPCSFSSFSLPLLTSTQNRKRDDHPVSKDAHCACKSKLGNFGRGALQGTSFQSSRRKCNVALWHLRLQKHKVNRYSVLEFEQVSTSWGNDHILSFKVTSHLFVNDGPFMLKSNVICEQTCPNPITMLHRNPANLICLVCCMVWLLCGSIPLTSLHLLSTSEPASLLRQLRFVWPPCIHSHSRQKWEEWGSLGYPQSVSDAN